MEPGARAHFESTLNSLRRAGAAIEEPDPPPGLDAALAIQRPIQLYETARNLGPEVARAPHLVSEHFRRQVAIGAAISDADYKAALAKRSRLVEAVREWAAACDAILTPPAPGEAPGLETTGDPRLCARWTLVGAPAISVPTGLGGGGLPLGLQLCGAPGEDRALLGAAAWVERALAENQG